jgi:hypothetical protein
VPVRIAIPDETSAAGLVDGSRITGAVLHTATGLCVVAFTDPSGAKATRAIEPPDGPAVYNALVAVAAGTYTTAP